MAKRKTPKAPAPVELVNASSFSSADAHLMLVAVLRSCVLKPLADLSSKLAVDAKVASNSAAHFLADLLVTQPQEEVDKLFCEKTPERHPLLQRLMDWLKEIMKHPMQVYSTVQPVWDSLVRACKRDELQIPGLVALARSGS